MCEREFVLPHFLNVAPAGVFILNSDGLLKDVSAGFVKTFGFDKNYLFTFKPLELIHPDDLKRHHRDFVLLFSGKINFLKIESRIRNSSGDYFWVLINITPASDGTNTTQYFVGCISNIESIKHRESRLIHERDELFKLSYNLYTIATKDSLTNMANRQQFMHWFGVVQENNKKSFRPFSLALMDIDHFKKYNDTYGHYEGDVALRSISAEITNGLSSNMKVARFGGEEFIILILNADQRSGEDICEELRCKIEGINYLKRNVTVSIGLVTLHAYKEGFYDFDTLYKMADKMLYVSKNEGRNNVRGVELV